MRPNPSALITIPPFYKLLGSHNNRLNLGGAFVSAALSAKGYRSRVYHCDSKLSETYITRYQMLFNSIDFYKNLETDESFQQFEEFYAVDRSDVVFVTCGDILNAYMDSGNWDSAKKISKIVRKINPKAFIVGIGPEAGPDPEDFDLLIDGEVELTLDDVMHRRIRGRIRGKLLTTSQIAEVPCFDLKTLINKVPPSSLDTIIWRRGCIGKCDFCRIADVYGGEVRCRPIDDVIKDIRVRYERLKLRQFYIVDANFTSHKRLVRQFCERIAKEFPDITWRTESRFDSLDIETAALMKEAGCSHVKLGLENALHIKHQVEGKQMTLDQAREQVAKLQEVGLKCIIYLILGGKWLTPGQYDQMLDNTKSLHADGYTVSLFTPYPQSAVGLPYDEWKKWRFIGSHLDIRLIDFWKIPLKAVEDFYALEMKKGREDKLTRTFSD